ncbi:MAG: nucleotide exchange factor GrpE [Bacteroidota bacterium]
MNNQHKERINSEELNSELTEEQNEVPISTDKSAETSVVAENIEEELTEKKKRNIFSKKKDSEVDTLKKKLEDAILEKSEMHDRYLRLYSEFDNYRKRTNKDKLDLIKNASEEMIRVLLPVVDDFERALKTANKLEGSGAMKEGVQLIYSKLTTLLKQKGLTAIESLGKPFDTDFHEAITNIPATEESQKGLVVDEIERGYLLNEKIIRYAKVIVAN